MKLLPLAIIFLLGSSSCYTRVHKQALEEMKPIPVHVANVPYTEDAALVWALSNMQPIQTPTN